MKRLLAVGLLLALAVPASLRAADSGAEPPAAASQPSTAGTAIRQGEDFFCVDLLCALGCIVSGHLSGGFCSGELCYCVGDSGGPAPILSVAPSDAQSGALSADASGPAREEPLECSAVSESAARRDTAATVD